MSRSTAAAAALRRRLARATGPVHDPELTDAPLSHIQEAIWLLDRFSQGADPSVRRPCVLTVPKSAGDDHLAGALAAVIERHHGLRSSYPIVDGSPRQILGPPFIPDITRPPDTGDWEEAVAARLRVLASRRQAIDVEPPLAAGVELLPGPGNRNALLLPLHHVMFDGLSEELLCVELTASLRAAAEGRENELRPPSLQPADWAIWQRTNRTPEVLEGSLDWWVERLDRLRHRALSPTAEPGPVTEHGFQLDRTTVARLVEAGTERDASLFPVLLHALSRSVEELTGESDLSVAVPVSGRTSASLEQVIGCFINLVVVRPGRSIDSARLDLLQALDHQEVPYGWIVNRLSPGAGPRGPLLDVSMQLRNFNLGRDRDRSDLANGADAVRPWPRHIGAPSRPVDITATPTADGLSIEVRGTGGRFGPEFTGELSRALAAEARRLAQRQGTVAPGPDRAPEPDAVGWIGASSPHLAPPAPQARRPLVSRIHDRFVEEPDRPALHWTEGDGSAATMSRAELWERSGLVADLLAASGAGPGDVIAIVGNRCQGLIVAQVAIMRLGAVLVILDPAFPPPHRSRVITSAGARLLVDIGGRHQGDDVPTVIIDRDGSAPSAPARTMADRLAPDPDDRAYLVYTSGTTGRPKGIIGTQRTWSHLADWAVDEAGLTGDDRVGFTIGVSFDVMFRTTIVPLAAGAQVVIGDDPLSPTTALRWAAEQRVTVLALTPTTARTWAAEGRPDHHLDALRATWFCGEVLTGEIVAGWEAATGVSDGAFNLYGPSESGSFKLFGPARAPSERAPVPVGVPTAETEVLLVDSKDRPAPPGTRGEVLIRTRGGGAGYLDSGDADGRFVPNPWRDDPADIVYRTGDVGYLNREGELVIIGRADHQVQIGGFRVELDGTAAVIEQLDEVRHCVVDATGPEPGEADRDHYLVAYVVPAGGAAVDRRAVIDHAVANLPRPAVPAQVVELEQLPLTPSGKLNRRALPRPSRSTSSRFPLRPNEIRLARIWSEVLGAGPVGLDDDFVSAGGTSLKALIVLDRIVTEFGVELAFNDLIGRQTLAEVTELVERSGTEPQPTSTRHRLTALQSGMWYEQQLHPDSDAYNIPMVHRLRGPLDRQALAVAFKTLVEAHEPLRTIVTVDDGVPVAEVLDRAEPGIEFIDLAHRGAPSEPADGRTAADAFANRPFDLSRPPLRVGLIRLAEDEHILAVVVHHIAFDGASKRVMIDWLERAYEAARSGLTPALSPPAVPFRDRPIVTDPAPTPEAVERRVSALSPIPARPDWPTRTESAQDAPTATVRLQLGPDLSTVLASTGRKLGATRAAVGLAAHIAFVHAVTGAESVLVAVPASLRRPDDGDVIGLFVNTLIVRAEPKADRSFAQLVDEVRVQLAAAFDARAIPFDRLARELRRRAAITDRPVTTAFQLGEGDQPDEPALDGLRAERHPTRLGASKFPVVASFGATSGEYRLRVAPTVGDEAAANVLAERGRRILLAALRQPSTLLADLETADEPDPCDPGAPEQQLEPGTGDRWLERLAAATVADPDRESIVWDGGAWSRSELWAAATATAERLAAAGCGTGSRIALLAGRSPELIAAMVGIRMVGAAWISLDHRQPPARIRAIVDRLGPDLAIADHSVVERLGLTVPIVEPGVADPASPSGPAAVDRTAGLGPAGDTAYLIATSGSTGMPRIVDVPPSALSAFVDAAIDRYGLTGDDRILQFHSTAFDAAIEEIGPALAIGATLVLAPDNPLESTQGYVRRLDQHRVTVASLPTRLWQQLVEDLTERRTPEPRGLRLMIIGGEAADGAAVRAWAEVVGPDITLLNTYGPTEATVVSHAVELNDWNGQAGDPVPIGRPIGQTRERVVDPTDPLGPAVAAGRPGELWLAGPQLARGYLDEPEMTAARFVERSGHRWFRTGDRVRARPDGSLQFLGRLDDQVKIRGHRVELAEVAKAIEQHPEVSAAAVVVEEAGGAAGLVAHVEAGPDIDGAEIRAHLAERLPDPLVPGRIVVERGLPRTPGGKVDRAALRAGSETPDPAAEPQPDRRRSEIPDRLIEIWMAVLETDTADPADDFFAVGGHSLLAVKLASRIEEVFGREIPLVTLVEDPTLGAIARHLDLIDSEPKGTATPDVPVTADEPSPTGPAAERSPPPPRSASNSLRRLHLDRGPLGSSQRRLWFLQQLDPDSSAYHIPVTRELRGRLEREALAEAIRSVAARHEALRTRFVVDGGTTVQVVDREPQVILDRVAVEPGTGAEALDAMLAQLARRPFRLDRDHPLRASLITAGPGHHVLQLVFHHVAVDGASIPVIADDLARSYRRITEGGLAPGEPPELQPLDIAVDEHARLNGGEFERAAAWWEARLAGLPGPLDLPRSDDGEAPARVDVDLDRPTTDRLLALAERHQASTNVIVLALTAGALSRLTGRRDLVIGLPAGQRVSRTEEVVGCFVNTLPIRCRLEADMSLDDLIASVRAAVIEAVDHRHLPVDLLIGAGTGSRDPGRPDLLQVVCNAGAATTRSTVLELPGLLVTRRRRRRPASIDAKFELSVTGAVREDRLRLQVVTDSAQIGRIGTEVIAQAIDAVARSADPDAGTGAGIDTVPITAEAVRQWLVSGLNPTGETEADPARVDQLVSARVEAAPDAIAIVERGRHLTYRQLWTEAEAAAARLDGAGVAAGDRVALIVDRSIQQVVWSLATLIRRAVYLPIDPANPQHRIDQLLLDGDPAAVVEVTGSESGSGVTVTSRLTRGPGPCGSDAAYLMYTSGSTGSPKGVLVPHRAIVRLVHDVDYVTLGPDTVMGHGANPAFDAATFEVWGALCSGARLVVIPPVSGADPIGLATAIEHHGISTLFLTTALFNAMVGSRPEALGRLDQLLFGGEAADGNAVRALLTSSPPKRLIHVYGPTETTTFATFHTVESVPAPGAAVPIGLPIDGTTVDVVDPHGQPCPTGVVGEVMIGGPGVASGYFGDPALTGERFVADPIRGETVGPVFKTGDLARRGSGGGLEFVGRRDRQIKLRGFRLDLGTVESVITAHPSITDCALIVVGDGSRRRLVGVFTADTDIDGAEVRAWAEDRLAGHEVPWRLRSVERIPLTANGKVDRSAIEHLFDRPVDREPALAVPTESTGPAESMGPTGPVTRSEPPPIEPAASPPSRSMEQRMLGVWRRIIGRPDLQPDEEFFDAGGHSLLAIELMDAVEAEFGAELFVSDVFEHPTATALAARVARSGPAVADPAPRTPSHSTPADQRVLVEIRPGTGRPLFCFHGGGGDVVGYANLAWQMGNDVPVIGVRAPGLLASGTIDRTIDDMLNRYLPVIMARNGSGPFRLCGHSFGGILAYAAACRLVDLGHQVEFLGLLDTLFPVDQGGPVPRLVRKFVRAAVQGRSEVTSATRRFLRHRYQRVKVEYRVASHRSSDDPVPVRLARRRLKMRAVMAASAFNPEPYEGPVVFFKAVGNRKVGSVRAEDRWRLLAPNLTVYEVEGRHTGPGSILTGPRVAAIVAEIDRRLTP